MGQFGKIMGVGAVCLGLAAGCGEENANAQNPGAAQVPEEVRMALQGCAGSPEAHKYFLDQAVADAQKNTAVVLKAACEIYPKKRAEAPSLVPDRKIAELALNDAYDIVKLEQLRLERAKIQAERKKQQAELAAAKKTLEEERIKHYKECIKKNKELYDGAIKTGATPELAERLKIPCEHWRK